MARRRWWTPAPLLLALLTPAVATVFPDFSFYPAGAQSCLSQAGDSSKCSGATVADLNECLCGNENNFIILAAQCIGKNDSSDTVPVYQTLVSACATSNTPLVIAPNQFYAAASGKPWTTTTTAASTSTTAATTTSDATTTSTTTSTSSSTASAAPVGSLSTGATIGIALGASFGGVGAIAGLVYFLLRRSKQQSEEHHPMLPHGEDGRQSMPLAISANDPMLQPTPSPGSTGSFPAEVKHASWVSSLQSPDPYRYSAAAYDASQGVYQGPYAPPGGTIVELPPDSNPNPNANTGGMVFEMDGAQHQHHAMPAEVPGDVPSVPRPEGR
ncbi:uncharacterized protein TrAtP1_002847 [Trichoderma atroviride]|uniref:Extracellular membrane protein CFEM domain-containing protein n=1 Tax=Hypocrea atroviridis (strain ATCC 20476 / IMI 206040) TaxID=452589 RepID=G9NXB9_HYPAI|nr:uncharacterized protein TRIATDRAFT_80113 [Trichoderma atroviride IMI 206040]EHK44730.1 hypothetical protein TRIATDRAFT_80113 [Trichoderma atroviride IMI 206040]UKZ61588.1 hypothetical protein TrAtP1_002847 [Trichoderma atroviride]